MLDIPAVSVPEESHFQSTRTSIVSFIPALQAFAWRFVKTQNDVDDLVQETLLKALNSIHHYQHGTALKSWLFTIMRNTFCTNHKKQRREPLGREDCIPDIATAPTQEWSIRHNELRVALNDLDADKRHALLLVTQGTSYEEAAVLCGCRIGTIKSRVNRARRDLMIALGEDDREIRAE